MRNKEALAKQEQRNVSEQLGGPVTADEKLARMKSELAYMRGQQEHGEPVAWQVMVEDETMKEFAIKDMAHDWCVQQKLAGSRYAYWIRPLYTTPQQRTWVGLTDDETYKLVNEFDDEPLTLALAIEAKLKEKNGG